MDDNNEVKPKARRGFAAMDPERRRAFAAAGGKASHAKGTGHRFTRDEAIAAGRKGGRAARTKRSPS